MQRLSPWPALRLSARQAFQPRRRLLAAFVPAILVLALFLSGCTAPKPQTDPEQDRRAQALVTAAREKNADILTTKGLGRLTLKRAQGRERFRIAWAAQAPDKLRLTVLASAHPVETIAASGEWVSIVSHTGKHKPHSTASTNPDLSPYINVPVKLSDMITILLGRFPLRPFDRAWFVPDQKDRVRTSKNFSPFIQEVQFDTDGKVAALSLLNKDETLVFRIDYRRYQAGPDRVMPETMTLTNAEGQTMDLTQFRIIPNPEVNPSVFRLTESGS